MRVGVQGGGRAYYIEENKTRKETSHVRLMSTTNMVQENVRFAKELDSRLWATLMMGGERELKLKKNKLYIEISILILSRNLFFSFLPCHFL